MPRRPGGLDPAEIDEALAAVGAAASLDELEAAIDRFPALSTPTLHAILRQEFLRLSNAKSPSLVNFEPRYADFFLLLHQRWHRRLVGEARAQYQANAGGMEGRALQSREGSPAFSGSVAEPYAPPFWLALRRALDGGTPPLEGPFFDPTGNMEGLAAELRAHLGRQIDVPAPASPTPGSRWSAVVVGCAACDRPRLDLRAYSADLVVAPELATAIREQRINNSSCPSCGGVLSYPLRLWVMEPPGPGDLLATLSCVWRLAPDVLSYQPPPGTPRTEENDRILEVRFDRLFRSVPWPDPARPEGRDAVQTTISVAYTPAELAAYLERATSVVDENGIPFAMATMVWEMTRKVESGTLPLHEAGDAVLKNAEQFGREWPVLHPGVPREFRGPLLTHLFHSLIAEGVLRARSAGAAEQAMFAGTTASSLLALGETALAEGALARAEDLLGGAEAGRARDLAAYSLADTRADLLSALERHEEAAEIRRKLAALPELHRDDNAARIARLGLASNAALDLSERGRPGAAIEAFRACIDDWRQFLHDIQEEPDAQASRYERAAKHALSGDFANLAAVFTTLAEDLVVAQIAAAPGLSDEERRAHMLASHPDPAGAAGRLGDAFDALERVFGETVDRANLLMAAGSLLRAALELSEEVEGWEFAGIQAHRLAVLHYGIGDIEEAMELARRAIVHAGRAGDHERIYSAHALLADAALNRGDGDAALTHLEAAARDRIRFEVGLGHHTELLHATEAFGDAAFRATDLGGDGLRAVMIVESLRAANTAASLVTGTPMQPRDGEVPEALARLTEEREKLRLRLTWHPDEPEATARLAQVDAELESERKRLSLRDPRFGRWVDATDVDIAPPAALQRRLAQLGANSLWLGVLAVGDRVWSYSANASGARISSSALPRLPELDVADAGVEGASWTEPLLQAFGEALLAPHLDRIEALGAEDALVLSVGGALHRVPFSALPVGGRPLCEWASILVVQGFGMFEAALDRPRLNPRSITLIGGPKRPDLDPLPGAAAELQAIEALLSAAALDVDLAIGARATISALAAAGTKSDVIHIASHALADPSPERASRLMLSPDIVRGDSGDLSEDRIISSIEVRPGALVNLAACATARIEESSAPLLGGLVPAFLLAGARSVIASLWPIADAPAAVLQQEIYREIAAGRRPAAALSAVQRRCARSQLGPALTEPSVWAAYVVYGGD